MLIKRIQSPNYYPSVASVDSSTTESTGIFPETLNKRINACVENKQKNKKTTNMQINSPPKLDTTKYTCIFHYHKQSMYLPLNKTNRILTHSSSRSPPFCHVLTKTTQ